MSVLKIKNENNEWESVSVIKGDKGDKGDAGASTWGDITGTLSNQTDLQNALNNKASSSDIPTKVSDLTNDSGYITTEADPTVPSHVKTITQSNITSWNNKSDFSGSYTDLTNKPTLFSGNYNDLTNKPTIPNKTSDLTNDSGFITSSSLPTKVSDLTNDTGFITNTVNNLTNYYTKTNTYTKSEVDSLVSTVSSLNIEIVQSLPTTDISTSTIYLVPKTASTNDNYDEYIYVNNSWEHIGSTQVDLSNYYTKTQVDTLLDDKADATDIPTKVSDLTNDSGYITGYTETDPIFTASAAHGISSSDITNWNNKSDFSGSYNDLTDLPVPTDIRINNSSIISGNVANLGVLPGYDSSTNPLATMGAVSQGMNTIMDEVDKKQNTLVSGTNIKTVNNQSLLGSGNITITGGASSYNDLTDKPIYDASYVIDAADEETTITNAQYQELNNASLNGKIIIVYGATVIPGIEEYDGLQYRTLTYLVNGNLAVKTIISPQNNNHTVTYEEIELASSTDLDDKQDTLVSGTNIKTVNSQSIVGSGNVDFYGTELPIGTEVDYVGATVPSGWQQIEDYAIYEINTGKLWIDGKPIYRGVAHASSVSSTGTTIGVIDNLDTLVSISGGCYYPGYTQKYGIPNAHNDSAQFFINALITNGKNIEFRFGTGFSGGFQNVNVIVEYTKTTD